MDAPEPGQGQPEGRPEGGDPPTAQPDEEEDLLAQMQAARGPAEASSSQDRASAGEQTAEPKAEKASSKPGERRRAALATVLLLIAVAIAGSVVFVVPGLLSHAPSATPAPQVSAASSGRASATPGSASLAVSASPSATARPSPTPSMPPQTAPTAQITFNELVLYPSLTAAKQPATFSFVSDGPGLVSASIVASAPKDASRICLSGDGGTPICASGATPTASFASQSIQSKWTITLGSANEESPTVDVQITWPSNKASVTVAHVPFQGHPNRDSLRSLTATVTPNVAGSLSLSADWPGSSLSSSLTVWLVDKTGQHVVQQKTYPAAEALPPSTDVTMKAGTTYRLSLADESPASTTNPDLTATIQLP